MTLKRQLKLMAFLLAIIMLTAFAAAGEEGQFLAKDVLLKAPSGDQEAALELQNALLDYESELRSYQASENQLGVRQAQLEEKSAAYKKGKASKKEFEQCGEQVDSLRFDMKQSQAGMKKATNVIRKYTNIVLDACDLRDIYFVLNPDDIDQDTAINDSIRAEKVKAALEKQELEQKAAETQAEIQRQIDEMFAAKNGTPTDVPAPEESDVTTGKSGREGTLNITQNDVGGNNATDDGTVDDSAVPDSPQEAARPPITKLMAEVDTTDIVVDEPEIRSKVKNLLIDIGNAYQDAADKSDAYMAAYEDVKALEGKYKMGLCEKDDYYDAQCKMYKLRGDTYSMLCEVSRFMYSLNDSMGGMLCSDNAKFPDIY